jgi:UDP-N-acetylglucosamine pyrophosphorylase
MLGIHAWIRVFLDPSALSYLALVFVYGLSLWMWLWMLRLWQAYCPELLYSIHPSCHSYWYLLEKEKRETLARQISSYNRDLRAYPSPIEIQPFDSTVIQARQMKLSVHPLVYEGKVAVFTFAAGQATRLGKGAKALLKLEAERESFSLLEYQARYLKEVYQQGHCPYWAILTSRSNHTLIVQHLKDHAYFELDPERIDCLCQEDLPLLDEQGRLWLHQDGFFLEGPCGNGWALYVLEHSGTLDKWHRAGIEMVTLNLIDNPLACPFEYTLLQAASQNSNGYSLAVIEKKDPFEKVGVLAKVRLNQAEPLRVRIVEYSDLGPELAQACCEGHLLYRFASTGVMSMNISSVARIRGKDPAEKGWHLAKKKYEVAREKEVEVIKRESFIFDLLAQSEIAEPALVVYERGDFFAPIKTAEDIPKVMAAIAKRDQLR